MCKKPIKTSLVTEHDRLWDTRRVRPHAKQESESVEMNIDMIQNVANELPA